MKRFTRPSREPAHVIIRYDPESGRCIVDPHELHVRRGESVTFEAVNTGVIINVPEEQPFSREYTNIKLHYKKRNREWTLRVDEEAELDRFYEYTIFCEENLQYVTGSSNPRMKVDE